MRKTLIKETVVFGGIPIVAKVVPLHTDRITQASFHGDWGVTTGAWLFEVSNDDRADPQHPDNANAKWHDITAAIGLTDPAGAASSDWVPNANLVCAWLKVTFTPSVPGLAVELYGVFVQTLDM